MTAETIAAVVVLSLTVLSVLLIAVYTIRYGIGPMPSSGAAREALVRLAGSHPTPDVICELGAGWGGIAFALARRFPSSRVIAYEVSPIPYLFLRLRKMVFPARQLEIRRADFFLQDLSDADLVVCYLYSGAMERLKPKLETELSRRAVVISNSFAVPGWKPARMEELSDLYRTRIYEYVESSWS